jgi:hypothetical protein
MATQAEKAYCMHQFHPTKSVARVEWIFWKQLHKNAPRANSTRPEIFIVKFHKMSGKKQSIAQLCVEPPLLKPRRSLLLTLYSADRYHAVSYVKPRLSHYQRIVIPKCMSNR